MLPRQRRLRRRKDIAAVLSRGQRVGTPALMLRLRRTSLTHPRLTVVVSTAVSKRATVRNRVKRQLRHMLVDELSRLERGVDLMVTVRQSLLPMRRVDRLALLRSLLKRARL